MKAFGLVSWVGFLAAAVLLFTRGTRDENEDKQYVQAFQNSYGIYAVPIPVGISFAGEKPPLADPDVIERLDREIHVNTYWQSNSLLMFKRANRFFPVIEPILKANGVPDDFKYLALIESGLTNVVSPAGAVGIWQIMKGTGLDYGLEINNEVDERYHLEKATEAACKYLLDAKEKFGSWTLAAASYNMGMNGLEKQLERQKATNYYNILLNAETARYVFRILAVKAILENPGEYGFHFREKDLYQPIPTQTVFIDTAVGHFADWAANYDMSYKTLKYHNPWLRQNYLHNKTGKRYGISVPVEPVGAGDE
jgi:membrane-bound lytic murein transglycosylase D